MHQIYTNCNFRNFLLTCRLSGLFLLFSLISTKALAQNYTVSNTTDGLGTNQLRGAIVAADAAGGTHTITVNAGTYNLTMGEITFGNNAQNITITGAGAATTVINMTATAQDRIFLINPPGTIPDVQTTISGITFTGGQLTSDNYGGGAIICGGENNSVTINNCVFSNNATTAGGNGGAVEMNGGGNLILSQCTFTNNVCPAGAGGALHYFLPNSSNDGPHLSGSLSVTGCTFNNNSVTSSSSSGGAIEIGAQGTLGGTTSTINILKNSFTGNHADATSSVGGAISITNSFSSTNTAFVTYNRFVGNTASTSNTSALAMSITIGSVDATNNWWGCNTGATGCNDKAARLAGTALSGTLTITPFLQLTATASASPVCWGSSSVVTASFTKNSAGTTIATSNLSAFTGVPVSFSAILGNLSGAQTTIQSTGTATATYTATGSGSGSVNAVVDNVPTSDASAKAAITVSTLALANATATGTLTVSSTNTVINNASCRLIAQVLPSGGTPVTGSVTGTVTIDGSQPSANGQPYLIRHYDITPATAPDFATATLTLYFLQSEFDTYNAAMAGTVNDLPTGPSDATGKANLRVTQYHGTGTAPGSYTGWAGTGPANVLINPGAGNVVWNSTQNWWEITFNVTGFSGFYVTGLINYALPVGLESFSGVIRQNDVLLNWTISEEKDVAHYEVQMSADALSFNTISSVTAMNNRNYAFSGSVPGTGIYYYRLKIVYTDGRITYSNIVAIQLTKKVYALHISPNPFQDKLLVQVEVAKQTTTTLILTDISGKVVLKQISTLAQGSNTIIINQLSKLLKGVYMLHVVNDEINETLKVVKAE